MNVKIGDLAVVIRGERIAGRVVEVVGPCPRNVDFLLPDGQMHEACDYEWIVKFQNPIKAYLDIGGSRITLFAPLPDRVLRSISGLPLDEEAPTEIKEPA